jgi:hypothetical protein
MAPVEFDEDLLGLVRKRIRSAHGGSEHYASSGSDVARFQNCPVHRSEKTVTHDLRKHRKVHFHEFHLPRIDRRGERAVQRLAGGRAGKHADGEFTAGVMLGHRLSWQSLAESLSPHPQQ